MTGTTTTRRILGILSLLLLVVAPTARRGLAEAGPPPAAAELDDRHLTAAIEAIAAALIEQRRGRTFWDPASWDPRSDGSATQAGGYTALAALGLLEAGISYQDPRLRDAIAHLEGAPLKGTYAVSMRASIWSRLPPKYLERLEADAQWLAESFSPFSAGWDYEHDSDTRVRDNSIRQFGALALWEASRRGVAVDPRIWQQLEEGFVAAQLPDGGWNYRCDEAAARGSMTCAGLATLFITQDLLHARDAVRRRAGAAPDPVEAAIARGLDWMDANFLAEDNPGSFRDYFYYAWCVERVGLASGRRTFAGADWFRDCAAEILGRLCAWDPETGAMTVHERMGGRSNGTAVRPRHLAFALLFLGRGRVPIAFSKLEIPGTAWNERPRDVANLAAAVGAALEREVAWQIVSIDDDPTTWLDAPMMLLAAAEPWPDPEAPRRPTPRRGDAPEAAPRDVAADEARLRRYLDAGGQLLVVADDARVARSIEELGSRLRPELAWRTLEGDHWAYALHRPAEARRVPLRALSNGVRELILVAPRGDLSATFQLRDERAEDPWIVGTNLLLGATERGGMRPRLGAAKPEAAPRRAEAPLRLVRARHAGAWNPEPAALDAFVAWLDRQGRAATVAEHPLDAIATLHPAPDLVLVTGLAAPGFTDAERAAIEAFAANSAAGVLLFETAGGTGDFAEAAERLLAERLGATPRSLARDPLVTGAGRPTAQDAARVVWRLAALESFGGREALPRLTGIDVAGRPRLLFSREDLSLGLLGGRAWGVVGMEPESTRRVVANVAEGARRTAGDAAPSR